MKSQKKAQGLSVDVIIIAAIALIVLVVLIAVFTGRFGIFTGGVKASTDCSKACVAAGYSQGGGFTTNTPAGQVGECTGTQEILPGYTQKGAIEGATEVCCCTK